MKRTLGVIGATVLCASGFAVAATSHAVQAVQLPYYTDGTLTPQWIADRNANAAHRVGDFHLTDQAGRAVTRRDVEGRVYVAAFFYTTCRNLCPTVRGQLARTRPSGQ